MSPERTTDTDDGKKASDFRRFMSQFVAVTVKNMLLFNMGLSHAFPAIIIPALTGISNEHNAQEVLSLTAGEASWLASSGYICELVGSIISTLIGDRLGRKLHLIVNIPLAIAWIMMYSAQEIWVIFMANALLGLAIGLIHWPVSTFIGEVSEPSYQSFFMQYTSMFSTVGMLFVFILNTLIPWRTAGLVCMFVSILTLIALTFIPETPLWLLSKSQTIEAEKALSFFRGWVSKEDVAKEFHSLQRYSQLSKSCSICIKKNQKCFHPSPTLLNKFAEFKQKRTLKPLFIVFALMVIGTFSGMVGMQPFIIQIFEAYGSPMASDNATVLLYVINNLSNIMFLLLLQFASKRMLYLTMLIGIFISSAIISGYGFIVLPNGYNSFYHAKEIAAETQSLWKLIPFVCILFWGLFTYGGVNSITKVMVSEIFPKKIFAVAAGISTAFGYILNFAATKSYFELETTFSLPGFALLVCLIVGCGFILMYFILPETEHRTQEDIELHFSDNSKNITDRKIARIHSTPKDEMTFNNAHGIPNLETLSENSVVESENRHN